MSVCYGPAEREERLATIFIAVERGITFLDTGDLAAIEAAVPEGAALGGRHPDAQRAEMDRETG